MNMYKAACLLTTAGLLAGCASTPTPTPLPCNCQPTRTVYVPVPVNKPVAKPVVAPVKPDASGNTAVPTPPKKPGKLQKLREDIKRLKDDYLRKKSDEKPASPDDFRG